MDSLVNFGKMVSGAVSNTVASATSETITVNGNQYSLDTKLGEGSFAFVFKATQTRSGNTYALKRIMCADEDGVKAVKNEINFLKKVPKHRYIVELVDAQIIKTRRGHEAYIVTEFCAGGTVYDLIERSVATNRPMAEKDVLRTFECACLALEHLHSQQPAIQHRDMKVENLLLTDRGIVLCDFGSCTTRVYTLEGSKEKRIAEEDIMNNTTMSYRSPEMCDLYLGYPIDEKCDIWALGVLLYRVAFTEPPWEPNSSIAILNSKYTIPKRHRFSQELIDLIPYCLKSNPAERPDIYGVIRRVAALKGKSIGKKMTERKEKYRAKRISRARSAKPKERSRGTREMSPERRGRRNRGNRRERSPERRRDRRERREQREKSPPRGGASSKPPVVRATPVSVSAGGSIAPSLFGMLDWSDAPAQSTTQPAAQQQPNIFAQQQQQPQHNMFAQQHHVPVQPNMFAQQPSPTVQQQHGQFAVPHQPNLFLTPTPSPTTPQLFAHQNQFPAPPPSSPAVPHMFPVQPQNSPVVPHMTYGAPPVAQQHQQAQPAAFSQQFAFGAQQQPQQQQPVQWGGATQETSGGFESSPFNTTAAPGLYVPQQQQQTSLDALVQAQLKLK